MKRICSKVGVLIISCDKYSDLWEPCSKMFNKFWPDCEYDKYILTNFKEHNLDGFTSIKIGQDISWSHGLKTALKFLENKYDYVFTMVEDYFFIEKIDNLYINSMFDSFINKEGNFLSLFKLPSTLTYVNEYFGELENNIPYRQSIGFTLWKINTLMVLLDEKENAWEFEKSGVVRGFQYDKFFGSFNNYKVLNLVVKGKLMPTEYRVFKSHFTDIDIDRPLMSKKELFIQKFRDFLITKFLFYTPSALKKIIYFSK
jgi:hypothetical protein